MSPAEPNPRSALYTAAWLLVWCPISGEGDQAMEAMGPAGAAYIDGRTMPGGGGAIPVTEWGYRRSDVTYGVVSVWDGAFFRLDQHLRRFRASMEYFRLVPPESDADIRAILHEMVR